MATTDPQKLPITVLSRCLQFNLKRISDDAISAQLEKLVKAEEISYEKSALHALARSADGSMRDSLSLLDQAIAYSDGNVTDVAIHEMLGTVPREYLHKLMQALANADAAAIMQATQELAQLSADFNGLFEDIIEVLHQVALSQAVPSMLETLEFDAALIKELSSSFSPEDVQLYYQIALIGKRDLYLSTTPQSALEMTLLRMLSFRPTDGGKLDNISTPSASTGKPHSKKSAQPSSTIQKADTAQKTEKEITASSKSNNAQEKNNASLKDLSLDHEEWSKLVEKLGLQAVSYSLASNCSIESITDESITLHLAQQHEGIATKGAQQRLEKALQEYFDTELKLNIDVSANQLETPAKKKDRAREKIQSQAEKTAESDAAVKALKSQFGAEIIEGSVKPVEN